MKDQFKRYMFPVKHLLKTQPVALNTLVVALKSVAQLGFGIHGEWVSVRKEPSNFGCVTGLALSLSLRLSLSLCLCAISGTCCLRCTPIRTCYPLPLKYRSAHHTHTSTIWMMYGEV